MQTKQWGDLLARLNLILDRCKTSNPELLDELLKFRAQLEAAQKSSDRASKARLAFQLAGWVRFLLEQLPPLDPP